MTREEELEQGIRDYCNSAELELDGWPTNERFEKLKALIEPEQQLSAEVCQAIGWAYADCCMILDGGGDPRQTEMSDVLRRAGKDLGRGNDDS